MLPIIFIIASLVTLIAALRVVTGRNVFHNALFLVLSFVGVAVLYILLEAEFLAVIQILVYVGAIAILIIFAVMLSRRLMEKGESQRNAQGWISAVVVAVLFLLLAFMLAQVRWPTSLAAVPANSISQLGQSFMGPYVLPFEVASVVLLVALVGSIIIARER